MNSEIKSLCHLLAIFIRKQNRSCNKLDKNITFILDIIRIKKEILKSYCIIYTLLMG